MTTNKPIIFACSDAIGETAESVARATARQFSNQDIPIVRFGHIQTEEEIKRIIKEASEKGAMVAYTLVQPDLNKAMKDEAIRFGVRAVDIMGPLMRAYIDTFDDSPKLQPGLLHQLNESYFKKIEAIEFAVKYDDGKDSRGLLLADLVLIGVSRTSKTPLSIFLAHKGLNVANLPIIPDTNLPQEIYKATSPLIVGLTIDFEHLQKVRIERLKAAGLPSQARYAASNDIKVEIERAEAIMKQLGCPIVNVSDRSIEETADYIMNLKKRSAGTDFLLPWSPE